VAGSGGTGGTSLSRGGTFVATGGNGGNTGPGAPPATGDHAGGCACNTALSRTKVKSGQIGVNVGGYVAASMSTNIKP
jgi:hypothetical protein